MSDSDISASDLSHTAAKANAEKNSHSTEKNRVRLSLDSFGLNRIFSNHIFSSHTFSNHIFSNHAFSNQIASPLVAIIASLCAGGLMFSAFGIEPLQGLYFFLWDPIRDAYGIGELFLKITPILLCAYGLLFCFKAGVWNIGAEGQYLAGAMAAGWCALTVGELNALIAIPLVLVSGIAGGLLWAAIAGLLKTQFSANEILTTIMLNYIAVNLLMFLVNGPLKDPQGFSFPESAIFSDAVMLPVFSDDHRLNISVLFPIFLMLLCLWLFRYTRFGFELQTIGRSKKAAKNAGIHTNKFILVVLLICGACAGLAGASEVAGPVGQLIPQLSVGYGYTAIIAVYLGRMHPVGILFASFLLGLTFVGAESVQLEYELPAAISASFQGMILFFLLASDYVVRKLKRGSQS